MASSPLVPRKDAPRISFDFGVDEHLHEAVGLALLEGARDIRHGDLADERAAGRCANFRLGHAGAAERRVGVERIGGDAIAHAPPVAVEQVGGHDLVVVVGGVGEGAAPVAVAQRPDARHVGPELVVDLDVAARHRLTPARSSPRSSVLGRRPTASSRWDPRPREHPRSQSSPMTISPPRFETRDALGVQADDRCPRASRNAASAAETSSSSRATRRGPISTIVTALPKRRIHLSELEPDVAAADAPPDAAAGSRGPSSSCW